MYDGFGFKRTYPIIQYHIGQMRYKKQGGILYTGGWLLPVRYLPRNASLPAMWEGPNDWTFDSGKSEPAYAASVLRVALLRRRRRWFAKDSSGRFVYYTEEQAKGWRDLHSHMQVLVAAEGVTSGPLAISVKTARSQALEKALNEFYRRVIVPVNVQDQMQHPLYDFWMEIGTSVNVLGEKGFVIVGNGATAKTITTPVAILPEQMTPEYLAKIHVPPETWDLCAAWYAEAQGWANEWAQSESGSGAPEMEIGNESA